MSWHCPLSKKENCNEPHGIGLDGGLKHVVVDALLIEKGWKVVNFPKRSWYPEFDQTHPSYRNEHLVDFNEDTDTLIVEKL